MKPQILKMDQPKFLISIVLFFIFVLSFMGVHSVIADSFNKKFVRVALLKDVDEFFVSIGGRHTIIDPATEEVLHHNRRLQKSYVRFRDGKIQVGSLSFPKKHIRLIPKSDIKVGTKKRLRRYRGNIDVIVTKSQTLLVVNTIELEKYVKGVLYHEVSDRWPLEATKAQAVAARTYALYQTIENQDQLYDLTSDIYSQVYGGRSAERYRTNIAANRTKGKIIIFKDKVIPAYYHATCGGHTEDAKELWDHDLLPLSGVVCTFCRQSPHYQWKKNFRSHHVQAGFNKNGEDLGRIKDISVMSRTGSDRAKALKILTRDGSTQYVKAKDFREMVGPNNLKSNYYDIEMAGYYFDVHGQGWGHGVGLCQWGARTMAQERYTYKEILEYYYPGITVTHYSSSSI